MGNKKELVGTFVAMLLVVALYFYILQDVFFEENILFSPGGGSGMSYVFVWIIIGVFIVAVVVMVLVIMYIGKKQAKEGYDLTGYKDIPGNPYN